jgi:Domain of unknown function (DUF4382)
VWAICAVMLCATLFGCGGSVQLGSVGQKGGNSSVVLLMTDMPPSLVTVLSAQVTLTGATLAPGNVSLFSGSATIDLTRLQTDIAYLATASNVPTGAYTSITLTFANPLITIENDTGGTITGCAPSPALICTLSPVSTQSLSVTVPLSAFSVSSSSASGLLIDVNLDQLLSATLGVDFSTSSTSVFPFTPGGTNAPLVGAEDVVGHVATLDASTNTFILTNAGASYTLKVVSATTLLQFPTSCTTPGFACLAANQILSVDIGIQADGSIVAKNIVFEDADNSDAEVEGIVTSTNLGSQQFNFVIHTISSTGTGLSTGGLATVQYSISTPATVFDKDLVHADNLPITITSSFSFSAPTDLVVGQEVSIRLQSVQGGLLVADRVRLRSSRISGTAATGAPTINLGSLPSLFSSHGGVMQILAQTSSMPPTIFYEVNGSINASTNIVNLPVAVRGPLFNTGGTSRSLIASKVVLK